MIQQTTDELELLYDNLSDADNMHDAEHILYLIKMEEERIKNH